MTAHSYVFDPATIRTTLFTALTAAVWLWSRVVIEWLVAPALRRAGRGRPAPYDWPRWVWRISLAARGYLGTHGHPRNHPQRHPRRTRSPARPARRNPAHHPRVRTARRIRRAAARGGVHQLDLNAPRQTHGTMRIRPATPTPTPRPGVGERR